MAKSYVKFEVAKDVVDKTYEALKQVKQSGSIKKGANEVTKSVERSLASFVVIAGDVDPEEVVMHLPALCEQKKIPFSYVPSKEELGKAIGLNTPCAAIAVENKGSATGALADIIGRVTGSAPKAEKKEGPATASAEAAKPQPKPQQPRPQQPKKEKAAPKEQKPAAAPAPAPAAAPKQ